MVNLKLKKIDYMERAVVDVGTVDTKSVTLPKRWLGILGLTDVKRVKVVLCEDVDTHKKYAVITTLDK